MFNQKEKLYFSFLDFEKRLTDWLIAQRHIIFLIILVALMFWFLSVLPYFNLLINYSSIIFVVIILSVILFKITTKKLVVFSLVLFLPALVAILLENYKVAELIDEFIYVLLFLGVILNLLKLED